jgi:copper transport protein
VASGTVQAAVQAGSIPAVTGTFYGHLLLAKVAGTAGILVAAAFAHRRVTRGLPASSPLPAGPSPVTGTGCSGPSGDAGDTGSSGGTGSTVGTGSSGGTGSTVGTGSTGSSGRSGGASLQVRTPVRTESDGDISRLRRTVTVELLVAVVVVALATALVQATPGRVAARRLVTGATLLVPRSPGEPVYAIERAEGLTLQVDVAPLQVGRNTMLMTLIDDAGKPVDPAEWRVEVAMPRQDIRNVSVPVSTTMGTGVAYALPQLSVPGDWTFTITVRTQDLNAVVMNRSVRVY